MTEPALRELSLDDGSESFAVTEPLPDRDAFLAELTAEVCRFVAR